MDAHGFSPTIIASGIEVLHNNKLLLLEMVLTTTIAI